MAFQRGPAPAREQLEPLIETSHQVVGGQRRRPRRGRLDREWDPVEAPTEHANRVRVASSHLEVALGTPGSIDEKDARTPPTRPTPRHRPRRAGPATARPRAARPAPRDPPGSSPAWPRPGSAADRVTTLAAASNRCSQLSSNNSARLAPRYSSTISSSGRPGAGNTRTAPARVSHTAAGSVTGASSHSQAPSAKSLIAAAATSSASRVLPTPPTPVKVTRGCARTSAANVSNSASRPDKRRHLPRQVPRQCIERPQRRELLDDTGCTQLRHSLRTREPRQPVLTEILQLERRLTSQLCGCCRHHDLAAVRDAHQSSGSVHRAAVVVAVAHLDLTRVQAHSHPQLTGRAPGFLVQSNLRVAAAPNACCAFANTAWKPSPVVFTTWPPSSRIA